MAVFILQEFVDELESILKEIKEPTEVKQDSSLDLTKFFNLIRQSSLFNGKLTAKQVEGIEAKIKTFADANAPVSHLAYALATSYHETARRMQPVKEGLNASDAWRKRNLRYYPYYGRGDVQLTWEDNYRKADKKLGLNGALINNLDLALDPVISSKIMLRGMTEGWFSADRQGVRHTLSRHLPSAVGSKKQFTQARRIINLMDKAEQIAAYAIIFQTALVEAEYKVR
jgi:putative chitinase